MNDESRAARDAYYAEAASWNRDRVRSMHRSQKIAWGVAIGASAIAVLEAFALVLLTPLKTVEPYTLMVDRTTGYVQALKPLDAAKIAPDTALTQSFLTQYVIAREGFDAATLSANYRKAALFSTGRARSAYLQTMQASNPESPLNRYPRSSIVDIRVKSVSPVGNNVAMVRFDTTRTDVNGASQPPASWIAVVRYRYSEAPMSLEDRLVNPLGFQVTGYRKDPEAAPPPPSAPSAAAVVGNAAQPAAGTAPYYPGATATSASPRP